MNKNIIQKNYYHLRNNVNKNKNINKNEDTNKEIIKENKDILNPSDVIQPPVIIGSLGIIISGDLKKNIIFKLNQGPGFYSQLFFLLQTYIYTQKTNSLFYIDSSTWCYTFNKGWTDYFETNFDYIKNKTKDKICSHSNTPSIPNYSLNDYINAINNIYILNKDLIERGDKIINQLDNNYIAIFIRRGDKITEAKFISIPVILSKINITNETKLFIQTDDYSVVEQIKILLPNNMIYSTVSTEKRGSYHNKDYLHRSSKGKSNIIPLCDKKKDQIKEETEEMLIGLYICKMAKECWVDHTSNVSRFVKLSSPNTVKFYSTNIILNYNRITICPAVHF